MLDRITLAAGETLAVDTTANSVTVYAHEGTIAITKDTQQVATLDTDESFTLPIGSGTYSIQAQTAATILLWRFFVY